MLMAVDVIRRAAHHAREGFELAFQLACDFRAIESTEIGVAHQRRRAAVCGQCEVQTDVRASEKGCEQRAFRVEFGMDDHAARRGDPARFEQVADAAAHPGREAVVIPHTARRDAASFTSGSSRDMPYRGRPRAENNGGRGRYQNDKTVRDGDGAA